MDTISLVQGCSVVRRPWLHAGLVSWLLSSKIFLFPPFLRSLPSPTALLLCRHLSISSSHSFLLPCIVRLSYRHTRYHSLIPTFVLTLSLQVPNLFPKDELVTVLDEVRAAAKAAGAGETAEALYGFWLERVRTNLHVGVFRDNISVLGMTAVF